MFPASYVAANVPYIERNDSEHDHLDKHDEHTTETNFIKHPTVHGITETEFTKFADEAVDEYLMLGPSGPGVAGNEIDSALGFSPQNDGNDSDESLDF